VIKLQVLLFLYGCCWGSFLMAAATRYRTHQSLLFPASHCDTCYTRLHPWQLVPGLSYWVLRGRCSTCHTKIAPITVIGELGIGLLATSITDVASACVVLELSLWLLAALCDHSTQTFPGWVSLGSFLLASWGQPPLFCLLVGGLLFLVRWCWPRWPRPLIGDGDLELLLCYWLGNGTLFTARWLLTASLVALLYAHSTRQHRLAFMPYLTGSALFWWGWPH